MPNSNRGVFGRGSGTITVIEEPVMRSAKRNAKIVFIITWIITGLLAATIAASRWHPVVALAVGAAIGLIVAAITAAIVAAWPVIRAIWWWTPEITVTGSLISGWVELAAHTGLAWRLISVAAVVGTPAAIRPVRKRLHALTWCLITRHRLRTCFSEFIIINRTGSLPLILWAWPTPVGERVWLWLRPGLAPDDIATRLDKIAVACWASTATVEAASNGNSAYVRIDLKRRDALTSTISSPLLELIANRIPPPPYRPPETTSALDLPDVTAAEVTPRSRNLRPARPDSTPPGTVAVPGTGHETGSDVSDWI